MKKKRVSSHGSTKMRVEWETQTVELDSSEYRMLLGEGWEPCGTWVTGYNVFSIPKVLMKRLVNRPKPVGCICSDEDDGWVCKSCRERNEKLGGSVV